jgi:cyclopropane-fatty-acyl-phospholipid synthase
MPLAETVHGFVGSSPKVRIEAFDGSIAGRGDAPILVRVTSPRAMAYMLRAPGELGLARAYVSGDVEIDGTMRDALAEMTGDATAVAQRPRSPVKAFRALGAPMLRAALTRAPRPQQEVKLRGRRHSKGRDARAIAHHYDVSNRFYELILGPSMGYTCAVFPREDATLEEAQEEKFDLVCRKLALEPGMRLLDVGCGWGGMVMHAAREYGVQALGVTLSRKQAEWAGKAIAEAGLADLAEVRHLDYRDAPGSDYDAVSSIGLTEHIGRDQLPSYFSFLLGKLRKGGRLLNHAIMRTTTTQRSIFTRGFINRYVFPDGELHGVGHVIAEMQNAGFEVRHEENLREHYARTLKAWCANLDATWDEAVAEVGAPVARVWRLYMAGSQLAFEQHRLELHQVLGVRVTGDGESSMPLRPDWEPRRPRSPRR